MKNTCLQEKYISTLHARVENLGSSQVVLVTSTHNLAASASKRKKELLNTLHNRHIKRKHNPNKRVPHYPFDVVFPGNVHDNRPVLMRAAVDLLGGPQELDPVEVHPGRFPNLDHVAPDRLDLLQVASHLVVELREPVGDPDLHLAPGPDHLVHVDGFHNAL